MATVAKDSKFFSKSISDQFLLPSMQATASKIMDPFFEPMTLGKFPSK
jgi:hypothetical protein